VKQAESVTFGGAGLNRAAEQRHDPEHMARVQNDPTVRILPVWRGKPLTCGDAGAKLAFVAKSHPSLRVATDKPAFLGITKDGPIFAQDISAWPGPETGNLSGVGFYDTTEQRHPDMPTDHAFADLRMIMAALSASDAEIAATAVGLFAWHRTHRFCANCGSPTDITMAGWQRACPACERQHFPRTDPVVIMLITRANSLLIGRSPVWPEGMYSLLAGFMEPGETIEAAVRREVYEETAVRVGEVSYLASQPWPFPSSLMIGCRGTATSTGITIDPKEIESAMWVTREAILDAWATKSKTLIAARKGSIANFLIRNWLSDTLD